jgi:hypothetical protein
MMCLQVVAERGAGVEVATVAGVQFPPTEPGPKLANWFLRGNDPAPGGPAWQYWEATVGKDEGWMRDNERIVNPQPMVTTTSPKLAGLADCARKLLQLQAWCLCWWPKERPSAWEVHLVAMDLLGRLEAEFVNVQ